MNSRVARIAQRTAFRVVPPPRGGFPTNDPPAEKNRTIKHHWAIAHTNLWWYHSVAPEWLFTLQQVDIPTYRKAVMFWFSMVGLLNCIVIPYIYIVKKYRGHIGMNPVWRPEHTKAGPTPHIAHLQAHNYENEPDWLGRRNAQFYKNWIRQQTGRDCGFSSRLRERGFPA